MATRQRFHPTPSDMADDPGPDDSAPRSAEASPPPGGGDSSGLEMDPEEMRRLGYRAVDRLVERWVGLPGERPWVGAEPEEMDALLSGPPPEEGGDAGEILERAVDEVLTRAGRIDHPRFFAFVPSSPTWPSVVADFLAAGFNVFQGTWLESAGPSQIERVVLDWFRRWLGLPEGSGGILTSGGSAANLVALVVARDRADPPPGGARVYWSDQGHSSLERAARIAGLRPDAVRVVAADASLRLDPEAVRRAIREDREQGRVPVAVCANAGATNTGAVDPLPELGALCREEDVWFHVDAAYGGFAVLDPEGRTALEGIGEADSVTLDPHKWLYQPYEAGCLLVRDPARLVASFRVLPEYLQDTVTGRDEINFADRGIQLSRGFRALKIWMSIQTLGMRAFREEVGRGIRLARRAEARIRESETLELLAPAGLGIVCFRARPDAFAGEADETAMEEWNAGLQQRVVEEGTAMISSTRLRGRYSLRLCIMNYRSRWSDVEAVLERVETLARESVPSWGEGASPRDP